MTITEIIDKYIRTSAIEEITGISTAHYNNLKRRDYGKGIEARLKLGVMQVLKDIEKEMSDDSKIQGE